MVRHYTRLSQWNFGVDTGMYPLGSCTMKYNPKTNERQAATPAHCRRPPDAGRRASARGPCDYCMSCRQYLAIITGLDAVSPATGCRGPRRAGRHAHFPCLSPQPGRSAPQNPHPGYRPRHQSGLRRPLRLQGGAGQIRRPGYARSGPGGLAHGRGYRRHHADQSQYARAV